MKPTTAARNIRIAKVYEMLLNDSSRPEIIDYCSKTWGIERAASDNLIQEATREIDFDLAQVKQASLAIILKKQRNLYNKAMASENLSVARQVLMDTAKLLNLDNHTTTVILEKREMDHVSNDDLDQILTQHEQH